MQRNTIAVVWLVGALLALGAYLIGPDRFLHVSFAVLLDMQATFQTFLAGITVKAFELIRALAIGLFVVFLVLGLIAAQRGLRARAALVSLTVLYLALLYPAIYGQYVSGGHWTGAFLLAGVGAVVMTRRLISATPPGAERTGSLRRQART